MSQSTEQMPGEMFAEALEASLNFKPPVQGEMLHGTIVSISGDDAFVSYGGPSEAVMAAAEVTDKVVGDEVEGIVTAVAPLVRISKKLMAARASQEILRAAHQNQIPVVGKIAARNKGGFDVNVSGVRAFCPLSQIDLGRIENPDAYIGQAFDFRITELSDDGRRVVVSRAALLKEAASAKADEVRKAVVPGAVLQGKVRSIMPFGAFVDLGGIDGLLHVSEMSRRRIENPAEVVSVGQEVTVKVLKIEKDGKRISLSMKDQEPDPWIGAADRHPAGTEFTGRILRVADFGLFVELEPGLEGLVHVSQLPIGTKIDDPSLAVGSSVRGWIRELDPSKKRIALALREVAVGDPWDTAEAKYGLGKIVEGVVERGGPPGVFVQLEPGLTGLIPVSELTLPPGGDPAKAHEVGERLVVKVISIDPARKRIALSAEGAKKAAERGEFLSYVEETKATAVEGKSAMALAFEKAMGRK